MDNFKEDYYIGAASEEEPWPIMTESQEKYFDTEIEPLLEKAYNLCKNNGIPYYTICQITPVKQMPQGECVKLYEKGFFPLKKCMIMRILGNFIAEIKKNLLDIDEID